MAIHSLPQNAGMYYFPLQHLEQLHDRIRQSRAMLSFIQAWARDSLSCSLNDYDRDLVVPVYYLLVELMEDMQSILPTL